MPKGSLMTSYSYIHFSGSLDCDLLVKIAGEETFSLQAGIIDLHKKYECYDEGEILIFEGNCSEKSRLIINYYFTGGYWR